VAVIVGLTMAASALAPQARAATTPGYLKQRPSHVAASALQGRATPYAPGGSYTPISATRVLDTRSHGASVTRIVDLGTANVVPSGASAVSAQITVIAPSRAGTGQVYLPYLTIPPVASLSWNAGPTTTETVLATLDEDRTFQIHTSAPVQLLVDVEGYFTASAEAVDSGSYHYFAPHRIMDTRRGAGGPALTAGATRQLSVVGGGVPSQASAVAINLIEVGATAAGYVTAYDPGHTRPHVASLSLIPKVVQANRLFVAVHGGQIALYNAAGTTQLVVEVIGYFGPGGGAYYHPLEIDGSVINPDPTSTVRVADTRWGGSDVPVLRNGVMRVGPANQGLVAQMVGRAAVASTLPPVTMVANVTAFNARGPGNLAAFPDRTVRPAVSDVSYVAGRSSANLVMSPLSDGVWDLGRSGATTDFVVDVSGYFVRAVPATRTGLYGWGGYDTNTNNDYSAETAPTPQVAPGTVIAVGQGTWYANYLIRSDHTLWGWGRGPFGLTTSATTLAQVPGATGVVAVVPASRDTAVGGTTYALRSDGTVLAWGENDYGQLGNDTRTNRRLPGVVPGLSCITAIAGTETAGFALAADGTVWAWGDNRVEQLGGASTAAYSLTPVKIPGLTNVVSLAADVNQAWAITASGAIWEWGEQPLASVASGPKLYTPSGGLCPAKKVSASYFQVVVLCTDQTVFTGSSNLTTASPIAGLTGVSDVFSNEEAGYALTDAGQVWDWGVDDRGTLGDGYFTNAVWSHGGSQLLRQQPAPINGLGHVTTIGGGREFGYAVRG